MESTMQTATPFPVALNPEAARESAGIRNPSKGNLLPTNAAMTPHAHSRELNETLSPEALADSPFVVSAWWSIRAQAGRLCSRLGLFRSLTATSHGAPAIKS